MNKKISRRNLNRKAASAATWLIGAAALGLPGVYAADDAKKEEPKKEEAAADEGELRNWIEVGVGGNFVHGDKSAFQQRTQQPREIWGGVTDFHYEMDVGKKSLFEVDGRGIFDAHNYSITLSYKDPDRGYARAGFEEFRNYYDLSGGYFPGNGAFYNLYPDAGEIDRRRIFFEAGLTLENKPQLRIRYEYDDREGTKNSTSWGDASIGVGTQVRKIVPSLNRIDESRHTIALDVSHTIGKTQAGIGGSYSFFTYDNARLMRRNPGDAATDRFLTHRESSDTDMFNGRAFTDTDFTDHLKLTTAYSYTRLQTDLGGSRAVGANFDADPSPAALGAFARRQTRDHGFDSLEGGVDVDQHVGAISLLYRPTPNIAIVPAVRIEAQNQDGESRFTDIEVGGAGAVTAEEVDATRKRELLDVTESLEARYTGVTNWVFYARAELLEGTGNLREAEIALSAPATPAIARETDSSRFTQKYTIGANWYPLKKLNVAAQAFHRDRENRYEQIFDSTPPVTPATGQGYYPAFIEKQEFTTEDANLRVTYRPINNLTFVTRYDFQYTTIDSKMEMLEETQSARSTAHIITEAITWMPINRMYVQVSGSYTMDRLSSPADGIAGRVQISNNNYYTASASVGFALTEKTDLSANYSYYLADNYDPSIFATGLPLNASLEEHTIGGAVVHKFNKRMQLTTRYAFITSHDATSGGFNDFDAHLVSTAFRYRF